MFHLRFCCSKVTFMLVQNSKLKNLNKKHLNIKYKNTEKSLKNKIISHIHHSAIRLDKSGCYQSFDSSMSKKPNQPTFSRMMVAIKKAKTFTLSPFNGYKFLQYNSPGRNFITSRKKDFGKLKAARVERIVDRFIRY